MAIKNSANGQGRDVGGYRGDCKEEVQSVCILSIMSQLIELRYRRIMVIKEYVLNYYLP